MFITSVMTESQTTCSIVEQHHGEETCADLENLQKKALSIPLSSISDIKKIGEGMTLYWQDEPSRLNVRVLHIMLWGLHIA